jgi:hypothetical protein
MNPKTRAVRLVDSLGSVRLAVVVMSALAIACIAATLYETAHGTAATQRVFYQSPWFSGLLALLAVNILLSTLERYPWNRHHAGFVAAHAGILLLLGGSLWSLHGGLDGRLAVQEGETTDMMSLGQEAMHVELPGPVRAVVPVAFAARPPDAGTRLPLPGTRVALEIQEFRPHVRMSEIWAESMEDGGTPALHFSLEDRPGQEGWLVAGDPHQGHFDFGPVEFSLHAASSPEEAAALTRTSRDRNLLAFVMGPDGVLRYAVSSRKGSPSSGQVREGGAVATPWMGLQVNVDRILRRAVRERRVARLPLPRKEEDRSPAVRVRLRGAQDSESLWLGWSESGAVPWEGGEAQVAYGPTSARLPFRVTLLDFRSEKYPGSSMPATYESRVKVDDPEQGSSEHLISMNRPLHLRGYTFFQASFVEGEPMTSILSVSRAPGLPLVYLGTALISLGILWMTALKSILARRQARAALAARRAELGSAGHPAAAGA